VNDDVVKDEPLEPAGDDAAKSDDNLPEVERPIDLFKDLNDQLKEARAQAAEYLEGWQRAKADFLNHKRRVEAERLEMFNSVSGDIVTRVLPAVDDFDRAAQTLPDNLKDNAWVNGVMLIQRKLSNVLDQSGVKIIPIQPGDEFDPTLHEAITHEDSAEVASGHIIAEVQHGYKLGERVLRPALVRVAK
jgi:molecular chaperone GrpE